MEEFGELRSMLHQPPSERAFATLMRRFERMWNKHPARTRDELFPYAQGVLETWPDATRTIPGRWRHAFWTKRGTVPVELLSLGRRLTFTHEKVSAAQLEVLISHDAGSALTHLELTTCELDDTHVLALIHAPSALRVLDLGGNDIGVEGARALAESALATRLTSLLLWDNTLGDEGVTAIASRRWPELETLDLISTCCKEQGTQALVEHFDKHFPSLRVLRMVYNNLSPSQIGHLKALEFLRPQERSLRVEC